ncbi:MAG: DUF3289 family protein [Planctomycetes bacterium]|jgi:hypothetical protein|nr:DUF3289 family protein [Planctomycetota bacterium]
MPPVTKPGPLGGATNNPEVDEGTSCLQASSPPGVFQPTGGGKTAGMTPGPVLVGKAGRDPGKNYDGSRAEDMMSGDKPPQSAPVREGKVFTLSDTQLKALMKDLMTSLSVGKMETVALEMYEKFVSGVGEKKGAYRSATLDAEVAANKATKDYHAAFLKQLEAALRKARFDPARLSVIPMGLLDFSSFWDKATGLGITIHQVWSVKAELREYYYDRVAGVWSGTLAYTFYDHFGLDWPDVEKNKHRTLPTQYTGAGFVAWYILQHYRSAKPFIVEIRHRLFLTGRAS